MAGDARGVNVRRSICGFSQSVTGRGRQVKTIGLGQGRRALGQQAGRSSEATVAFAAGGPGQFGRRRLGPPGQIEAILVQIVHGQNETLSGDRAVVGELRR